MQAIVDAGKRAAGAPPGEEVYEGTLPGRSSPVNVRVLNLAGAAAGEAAFL